MRSLISYSIIIILALSPALANAQHEPALWRKTVIRQVETERPKDKPATAAKVKKQQETTLPEELIKEIKAGRLPAYAAADNLFTTRIGANDDNFTINDKVDTMKVLDPVTGTEKTVVKVNELHPEAIYKYRTLEEWTYNPATGTTNITITGIAPVRDVYGDDGMYRGVQAMFWMRYKDAMPVVIKYEQQHAGSKLAQLLWSGYFDGGGQAGYNTYATRAIDMSMPEDTAKHYLRDAGSDSTLQEIITTAALDGRLPVYEDNDHELKTRVSNASLRAAIITIDTIQVTDPTTNEQRYVVQPTLHNDEHGKLLLSERWRYQPEQGSITIQLAAIYVRSTAKSGQQMMAIPYASAAPLLAAYDQYNPTATVGIKVWNSYFAGNTKPEAVK